MIHQRIGRRIGHCDRGGPCSRLSQIAAFRSSGVVLIPPGSLVRRYLRSGVSERHTVHHGFPGCARDVYGRSRVGRSPGIQIVRHRRLVNARPRCRPATGCRHIDRAGTYGNGICPGRGEIGLLHLEPDYCPRPYVYRRGSEGCHRHAVVSGRYRCDGIGPGADVDRYEKKAVASAAYRVVPGERILFPGNSHDRGCGIKSNGHQQLPFT